MVDIEDLTGEEFVKEKKYLQDINNLSAKDVLEILLHTIDEDMTMDIMEKNILEAINRINTVKFDRLQELLGIEYSWDFKKEEERRKASKVKVMEVKT